MATSPTGTVGAHTNRRTASNRLQRENRSHLLSPLYHLRPRAVLTPLGRPRAANTYYYQPLRFLVLVISFRFRRSVQRHIFFHHFFARLPRSNLSLSTGLLPSELALYRRGYCLETLHLLVVNRILRSISDGHRKS